MNPIPAPVAEVYDELKIEVTWLHGRWIIYQQLFDESDRRIKMLNECASAFFYIIQDVLQGEVQVSLSKLTDPASRGTHDNLSLEQLQRRLEKHGDNGLAGPNTADPDTLHLKCQPFRAWRNRQLAHLDLPTSIRSSTNSLPGVSRQMIEEALSLVRNFMNKIEAHYNNGEIGYEHFLFTSSDGDALLAVVRNGLRYEELVEEGVVPYDDWRRGKWKDA